MCVCVRAGAVCREPACQNSEEQRNSIALFLFEPKTIFERRKRFNFMIPCERSGAPRAIYAILIPIHNRVYSHFTCHFLFAVFGDNGAPVAASTLVCLSWRCHFPNLMPRNVRERRYGTTSTSTEITDRRGIQMCLSLDVHRTHTHTRAAARTYALHF